MKAHLEEISVVTRYGFRDFPKNILEKGVIVPFIHFEGKMLDSNIWIIFKELKIIEVRACWDCNMEEKRKFFREDWMLSDEFA